MDRNTRSYREFIADMNVLVMAYWFSTMPHTTSIEVFGVFVGLEVVYILLAFFTRNWLY